MIAFPDHTRTVGAVLEEGRDAFIDGTKVGDNPYPPESEAHWYWTQGWVEQGLKSEIDHKGTSLGGFKYEG